MAGIIFFIVTCLITFKCYWYIQLNNDPLAIEDHYIRIEPLNSYFRFKHGSATKDWHDYKSIAIDSQRKGPGEQGKPVFITKDEEEGNREAFELIRHNGFVSDKIARDRSLPDTRPFECQKREYLEHLPSVSVVITFHNEVLSTLMRTVHSVFTRSPPELLKEVILVNDHSDMDFCYGPLEKYVEEHFDSTKIRILVMPKRSGLIWGRLAGARAAKGDVLVFLDCHTEANVNWLPPLLEPIAKNYRTCVCPYIDVINAKNYQYDKAVKAARGVFNWQLSYKFIPLRPGDQKSDSDPFRSPVMMGCKMIACRLIARLSLSLNIFRRFCDLVEILLGTRRL